MIPLPPEPAVKKPILDWAIQAQKTLRALRPIAGPGIKISESTNNLVISATQSTSANIAFTHPFQAIAPSPYIGTGEPPANQALRFKVRPGIISAWSSGSPRLATNLTDEFVALDAQERYYCWIEANFTSDGQVVSLADYSDTDGHTATSLNTTTYEYDPDFYFSPSFPGYWKEMWTGTGTYDGVPTVPISGGPSYSAQWNGALFNHPEDLWILDSTEYPSLDVMVQTYVPGKYASGSSGTIIPDTDSTGSLVVTTTLSNEYADLESDLSALLSAAEGFSENVWWYPADYFLYPPTGGYRVSADYAGISDATAAAAVSAAEDDVAAKESALSAIAAENTFARHVAQNQLEYAQLGLSIAEHNQLQVGNSTDPILLTLSADGDPAESYRRDSEDGSTVEVCSVRFRIGAAAAPNWPYAEKPVRQDFRWRRASGAAGATAPTFSSQATSSLNAVPLLRIYDGGYQQKYAVAIMDAPLQLAAPSSPGWVALANPLPLGETEPAPFSSSWTERSLRQAAAQKLGFMAYLPPEDGVPVIYRRETASGSAEGYHEFKETIYLNEDNPEDPPWGSVWEYDATNLPESLSPANTSTYPGDSTPHLRNFPQRGAVASPTVQTFGPLTMTLSLPWTTEEIQGFVDAHVDAAWPDPPDYPQPPYVPDTNAAASLPPEPRSARWLPSAETYYLRARSRYRSDFALPDSIRKHPDFSSGVTVTWFWQLKTLNLDTNEVTSEDISEAILYGPESGSPATSDTWRDLPSPEGNAIKWVTKPKTLDSWAWTSPECRPGCVP